MAARLEDVSGARGQAFQVTKQWCLVLRCGGRRGDQKKLGTTVGSYLLGTIVVPSGFPYLICGHHLWAPRCFLRAPPVCVTFFYIPGLVLRISSCLGTAPVVGGAIFKHDAGNVMAKHRRQERQAWRPKPIQEPLTQAGEQSRSLQFGFKRAR